MCPRLSLTHTVQTKSKRNITVSSKYDYLNAKALRARKYLMSKLQHKTQTQKELQEQDTFFMP